jgi:hypothetical protein
MPDLDQGGTFRETTRIYQGPSLGWSQAAAPPTSVAMVTVAGTTVVQQGTSLVHVNVNGSVTLQLPAAKGNPAGAGQVPGSYLQTVLTINDVGGFAQAFPITVLPAAGETISGGTSFIIGANYGLVSLLSDVLNGGWTAVNSVSGSALTDAPNDGFAYGRLSAAWGKVVPLAGGTMTGALVLNADPAAALGAATKQYVDTGLGAKVAKGGDTMTGLLTLSANPTAALGAATKQYVDQRLPRSYLAGLTMSTSGPSTTFSVAAGEAVDSTSVDMMALASALSKTTAAWVVGAGLGALDTGVIAINTWYHAFLIKRTDTGVVDVLVSLSPSAPTLPPSYSLFRRIGSLRTNASSQWTLFIQLGDEFLWLTALVDMAAVACSATSALRTLTVPTGVQVWAKGMATLFITSAGTHALFYSPDMGTQASGAPAGFTSHYCNITNQIDAKDMTIRTNTSAQISVVSGSAAAGAGTTWVTYGWTDRRGRDA